MNTIAQIFPRTGRISGPEVTYGAKPDVPTTDVENEKKKKKHRVFYEAVDAHARRRLKNRNAKIDQYLENLKYTESTEITGNKDSPDMSHSVPTTPDKTS